MGRFGAARNRNRQSNSGNDREEPDTSPRDKQGGAEHKHRARVTNFPLVVQKIAFDNEKGET
jgi:hypothetical protein